MKKRTGNKDITYKGVNDQFLPRQEQGLPVESETQQEPKQETSVKENAETRLHKATQRFVTKRT